MEAGEEFPFSAERVVVVFTTGCFEDGGFVQRLLSVHACGLQVLPVIAEDEFQVGGRRGVTSRELQLAGRQGGIAQGRRESIFLAPSSKEDADFDGSRAQQSARASS